MTYAEMIQNILSWTETDSAIWTQTTTNDLLDDLIRMVEYRIFRDIEIPADQAYETATVAAPTAAPANQANPLVAMPGANLTDFSSIRYAQIYTETNNIPNERHFMTRKDLYFLIEYWPNRTTPAATGIIPKYFAVWDQQTIYIAPSQNQAYKVELALVKKPTSLVDMKSTSPNTTWLSVNAPRAFLFACLSDAFKFLKGPAEMLQLYEQSYQLALQGLATEQLGKKKRDEYRDGELRVPVPSNNP